MTEQHPRNAFTGRHAVDPGLRRVSRLLPRGYALHRGLAVPRALMALAGIAGRSRDVPEMRVNDAVMVRVHRPRGHDERGPALLWIHGGGTLMGTAAQDDAYCRRLSRRTGVAVVAVEHRLAPEHPYPIPRDDCYAALRWLARQPWVDPARIAVGGASAGGMFAAALAQHAHDRGEVTPAFQLLVYPMLDDRTGAVPDGRKRIMWSERDNQLAWRWYLGSADPADAVPARRVDLTGLAPAWIGVGTLDLFHAECLDYGARLRGAGVPVRQEIAAGGFHAFDQLAPNAPVSMRFFDSLCHHLRVALGVTEAPSTG